VTSESQPEWLEPELASLTRGRFSDPAWIFERKLDGERCLAFADGRTRLMTRNRKEDTTAYPEIAGALDAQQAGDFIVDGEIVTFDGSQASYYYLFDLLWAGGEDLRGKPLRERKRLLRDLLAFDDPLRFTEHRDADGEAYFREACAQGWEGIIAKRAGAPYRAGRGRDWLKFTCEKGQEFVIGGYTDPHGLRTGLGALLLGFYNEAGELTYAGKVGTGFDRRTLDSLHTVLASMERDKPPFAHGDLPRSGVHWAEPRLVGHVAFTDWTADGQLRHPRFQGLRRDKEPADVVRETPS
jgi:DNA ligase D